jgi:thymidylate synthase (FAD)
MTDEIDLLEMPEGAVPVLDCGYVLYVDHMGTDDDIVEAARLSYGRGTKKTSTNTNLIKYLYSNRHTSPFEMVELKVQIRMPIFVMRQWVRHRTANLNEYSGRYSIMPRMWYNPAPWDIKRQHPVNHQASGDPLDEDTCFLASKLIWESSNQSFNTYEKLLSLGVSREMARIVLPLNTYTEIVWKMDLNNLLHFLRLRDDSHAQPEIQAFAREIGRLVKQHWPVAYEAYEIGRESVTLSMDELTALITGNRDNLSKSQKAKSEDLQRRLQQKIGLQS